MDLNIIWFILIGVLFAGYGVLDGFDLGVGALHLLHKGDHQRRISINSIGPVWDGNEVWLVTGGGALFAAFPEVYATLFSGFYVAFHLFLAALIFRAVALDFRSKRQSPAWRATWDVAFSVASIAAAILLGVTIGNIAWGIPIDANGEFAGSFFGLLHPYALLAGVTTLALFMMHGSIYLHMKTEGEVQDRVRTWIRPCIIFFILSYSLLAAATLIYVPRVSETVRENPVLFLVATMSIIAIANIPREIHNQRHGWAFLSSSATLVLLMALFALTMFPNLLYSQPNPEYSLNAFNHASSQKTLGIMLTIAVIGMPIVISYTVCIYWIFRGKVKINDMSY